MYANTGRARLVGGEVSALWAPLGPEAGLEMAAAAAYVRATHAHDDEAPPGVPFDDHLAEMPPMNGVVAARYVARRWRTEVESR